MSSSHGLKGRILRKFFAKELKLEKEASYNTGWSIGINAGVETGRKMSDKTPESSFSEYEKVAKKWLVDPEWVFSVGKGGHPCLEGKPVTVAELKSLKAEAKTLKQLRIWEIFQATVRKMAIDMGFMSVKVINSPEGTEQIIAGKMMVYALDVLKTVVEDIDRSKLPSQ